MKFSTSLIALVAAGLASAQLPDVPACSLSCFVSALGGDGCSELLDFECHCQKPELVSTITPCVEKACEYEDQVSVSNAVTDQCKSAGHPISIPPIKSDGGEESSTAAPTTTSAAETTAKPTETSESSSAVETGSSSAVAPPPGTTSTGSTSVGSSSGVATSTPLVSKTGAAPSSSSPAFNGAGSVKGNMAGVAAIAAAAAYVL